MPRIYEILVAEAGSKERASAILKWFQQAGSAQRIKEAIRWTKLHFYELQDEERAVIIAYQHLDPRLQPRSCVASARHRRAAWAENKHL
jgi:hypothetical protein